MKLYSQENKLRRELEARQGEDAEAKYQMEKELNERRMRMKFTEAIIKGKEDKIDKLTDEMKAFRERMIDMETAYNDVKLQRDAKTKAYEDREATIKDAEERIHEIYTSNQELEEKLESEIERNHKMSDTLV